MSMELVQKVAWGLVTFAFLTVMSMLGWLAFEVMDRPNRVEVERMIETHAPYIKDREMIRAAMSDMKETNKAIKEALDNNTKVITRLDVSLATFMREGK